MYTHVPTSFSPHYNGSRQETRVSSSISMENTNTKKKPCGSGRKKIEIKRIEKTCRRRVAFSKRRKGLFNKAGELCRLCDANMAVIIFSPSGRMFTFGHPSTEYVVNRFLSEDDETESLETAAGEEGFWWEESVRSLNIEELEKYKDSLRRTRDNVAMRLEEMVIRRNCEIDYLSLF